MTRTTLVVAGAALMHFSTQSPAQNWVNFVNETSTRLVSDPSVGVNDPDEKDYAYADFDQDGDVDLVCVRKQGFVSPGRRRNVLFINEGIAQGHSINGVLVDRTALYASAADDGGQGMLDLTNDRDVTAVDVNGDGWLDLVTATTYGAGLPKTISHPRIYINRGEVDGVWQGFKYEQARIPSFAGGHPNFCGVGAGDVTGNKSADLYFVAYRRAPLSAFDDRLLINDGNGYYTDQTTSRMTSAMHISSFGTSCYIADMNGDGKPDIVKSENGPVKIIYNGGNGFFNGLQTAYSGSAYFTNIGDLNGDGRLDIVASDDSTDRYLLNTGPSGSQTGFNSLTLPNSGGIGNESRIVDLNNDGLLDIIITDVDVEITSCSGQMKMWRNLGNTPNVSFGSQGTGGIPSNMLTGTHDVAVFDINGDGWKDLVIGRCNAGGTQVWIQQPPSGLVFTYPQGLPGFIGADQPYAFQVSVSAVGGSPLPNSGVLHYSINNGLFTSAPMTMTGANVYSAELPAAGCTDSIRFYVSAQLSSGGTFTDPPGAPGASYTAIAADGTEITNEERFEIVASGWTVTNHASLTGGAWEQVDPNGTINAGQLAAPEDDAGAGDEVMAFVTHNGAPLGPAAATDVDGGPTWLTSPVFDLAGTDANVSYHRWFYCEDMGTPDGDFLHTEISNNGGLNWTAVHQTGGTGSAWEQVNFRVGDFVTPTSQVRFRFWTSDIPNNSVTEAGIDNFIVEELICGIACPSDVTGDNTVNVNDLLTIIGNWAACPGPCPPACTGDINHDCAVNVNDLLLVINAWGPCGN